MTNASARPRRWAAALAIVAGLFGAATISEGGRALFSETARAAAGNIVPFVLWFNFAAGFFYLAVAAGFWFQRTWAVGMALAIALATAFVFLAFGVHVATGGAYEARTAGALTLRTLVWALLFALSRWQFMPRTQAA